MYLITYTVCVKNSDVKKIEKELKNLKNICVETFLGDFEDDKTFIDIKVAIPEDSKDYKVEPEEIISKYDENFEQDCCGDY